MPELASFQTAFTAALAGDTASLLHIGVGGGRAAAGLAVYRNTVARGTIDALATNYSTVRRLVGEPWFEAAARAFIAEDPPREGALITYGAGFTDFLGHFEPARALPYLSGVARLDRLWLESHTAADAPAWTTSQAARVAADALFDLALAIHPAARFALFDTNLPTLWLSHRPPGDEPEAVEFQPRREGLLLTRPGGAVEAMLLDPGSWTLLDACSRGALLGEAAGAALDADPGFDVAASLLRLVEAGAFAEPVR